MNIITVLEIISAIATILLFFVKVDEKDKKLISLKTFVFWVFIICSVVFVLSTLLDKADGDKIVVQDEHSSNDNNWSELNNDELIETSSNEYTNIQEEPIDGFEEQKNGNNTSILKIDSIVNNEHAISTIKSVPFEIQSVNLINYSDEIYNDGQYKDYEYVPLISGTHRFEFSNVPNGTDFRLRLFNSGWESIASNTDLDNGDGLTEYLTAGETYYIRVEQYREFGPYTLNVGPKKEIVDITDYTAISDSIQYTNQENDYLFVAERDGTYRFEFSHILEGDSLRLEIFNSGWERETSKSYLDNGASLDGQLLRGETYYIRVIQQNGVSDYILSIKYQGIQ